MASNQFHRAYSIARREGYADGFSGATALFEIQGGKLRSNVMLRVQHGPSIQESSYVHLDANDTEIVDSWIAGYLRGYDEGEERQGSHRFGQDKDAVEPTEEDIERYKRYLRKRDLTTDDMVRLREILRIKRAKR